MNLQDALLIRAVRRSAKAIAFSIPTQAQDQIIANEQKIQSAQITVQELINQQNKTVEAIFDI